jgi:hypothetical protein
MLKKLLALLEGPFNPGSLTWKGDGSVDYFKVPVQNFEKVRKLLGVEINESKLAYCENLETGYKSDIYVEIYTPISGRKTAQLYGLPYDQTDDPYLYLSNEVVLN